MNFTPKGYHTEDDYMTKKSTWKSIEGYLPKDKVIWEAFWGDGSSGAFLRALGFEVIHKNIDLLARDVGHDDDVCNVFLACQLPPLHKVGRHRPLQNLEKKVRNTFVSRPSNEVARETYFFRDAINY